MSLIRCILNFHLAFNIENHSVQTKQTMLKKLTIYNTFKYSKHIYYSKLNRLRPYIATE